jgi:hypothetical protein
MSNLSTIVNDNQANLKGAVFHFKVYAIVLFVCGGLIALLGLPLLLLFGLGIIYIAFGVLYIFLGFNMLNASKSVKNIIGVSELSQDEYNTNSMNAIIELKKHFKILNIMMAVFLGLGLIGAILFAATIPALINEINKSSPGMMGGNPYANPAIVNPYQTQSNKTQTAGQMGMTDKEHSEMHDPKNIVNTDYSQLDYGNTADQIKATEDAYKNVMDKMTPEQRASAEKILEGMKTSLPEKK